MFGGVQPLDRQCGRRTRQETPTIHLLARMRRGGRCADQPQHGQVPPTAAPGGRNPQLAKGWRDVRAKPLLRFWRANAPLPAELFAAKSAQRMPPITSWAVSGAFRPPQAAQRSSPSNPNSQMSPPERQCRICKHEHLQNMDSSLCHSARNRKRMTNSRHVEGLVHLFLEPAFKFQRNGLRGTILRPDAPEIPQGGGIGFENPNQQTTLQIIRDLRRAGKSNPFAGEHGLDEAIVVIERQTRLRPNIIKAQFPQPFTPSRQSAVVAGKKQKRVAIQVVRCFEPTSIPEIFGAANGEPLNLKQAFGHDIVPWTITVSKSDIDPFHLRLDIGVGDLKPKIHFGISFPEGSSDNSERTEGSAARFSVARVPPNPLRRRFGRLVNDWRAALRAARMGRRVVFGSSLQVSAIGLRRRLRALAQHPCAVITGYGSAPRRWKKRR